ncbi:MAG: hypothetical protein NWE98_10245 [Candidatus Bathyarchaeota archaeon]|nr:hypothetical protein [Candidatus Bathyarchaeota archaeon]
MGRKEKIEPLMFIILICILTNFLQQNGNYVKAQTTMADKKKAFITDVLGLDLAKYNVTIRSGSTINAAPFNVGTPFRRRQLHP